jgi:hypothetical protein
MYHEDRLGGSAFSRVWLTGVAGSGVDVGTAKRDLESRLGTAVETVDVRRAATLGGGTEPTGSELDALAAPTGILLRDGKAA